MKKARQILTPMSLFCFAFFVPVFCSASIITANEENINLTCSQMCENINETCKSIGLNANADNNLVRDLDSPEEGEGYFCSTNEYSYFFGNETLPCDQPQGNDGLAYDMICEGIHPGYWNCFCETKQQTGASADLVRIVDSAGNSSVSLTYFVINSFFGFVLVITVISFFVVFIQKKFKNRYNIKK